ncbi:MAG: TIGR03986 family CRISPR-associated RAMP protein [Thermoguttaceae bacterium]|nr:TIGR03986 family CRISPR-associated RAMP protein [Thermoguttaceae bacterium]MDW8037103.1 TIGR03986 family CRISPR-associated RAMP protein [Thermoguttaceae bacterium]
MAQSKNPSQGRGNFRRPRQTDPRSNPFDIKPADSCEAPYHFVPIEPGVAITDTPVFHDIQQTGDDFWSGQLQCTLTALTPLLVGNYQIEYRYLAEPLKTAYQRLLQDRRVSRQPPDDKKLIEPLSLPPEGVHTLVPPQQASQSPTGPQTEATGDRPAAASLQTLPGRIVISARSLKGMIRQSLQALLSAPMERVQERKFSFRPNLADAERIRPAIVHRCEYDAEGLKKLEVEFCPKASQGDYCGDIIYVLPDAVPVLEKWLRENDPNLGDWNSLEDLPIKAPRADINNTVLGLAVVSLRFAKKLRAEKNSRAHLEDYVLVRYREGLDGTSTFKQAFGTGQGYQWALVKVDPTLDPKTFQPISLPECVLREYNAFLNYIADSSTGHLVKHPNAKDLTQVPENIRKFRLQPGDLIFVEYDGDPEKPESRIIGIGHHFRFRRLYRDSIHTVRGGSAEDSGRLRKILCPLPEEQQTGGTDRYQGAPKTLTGARNLFGYVGVERDRYDPHRPNEPMTFGIGEGDFSQLAGRISINMAVEVDPEHPDRFDANRPGRFLNPDYSYLVPLRPLGSPKPSAVEMYLTQDRLSHRKDMGTLCTYGDTFDDASAGDLRGRKFYLHQPDAANSSEPAYQQSRSAQPKGRWCYELFHSRQPDWKTGDTFHLLGNQAPIARFVSCPGTKFRFTIHFRNLRSWELGALLFTLTADEPLIRRLVEALGQDQVGELNTWLARISGWQNTAPGAPLLALKLGHGRPLGLGSVHITIDKMIRLRFDSQGVPSPEECNLPDVRFSTIQKLAEKIRSALSEAQVQTWAKRVLLPWLQVHRYAGRKSFDYPRKPDKQGNLLIYEFHSQERKKHAKGRKLKKTGQLPPGGLKSLDQLDEEGK